MGKLDKFLLTVVTASTALLLYAAPPAGKSVRNASTHYGLAAPTLPRHNVRTLMPGIRAGVRNYLPSMRSTSTQGVGITGFVAYSDADNTGTPARANGLWQVGADGTFTWMNATDFSQDLDATYGGVLAGDKYYAVYVWESGDEEIGAVPFLQEWDPTTWTLIDANFAADASVVSYDLTYSPADGNIYGLFVDGNTPVLGILDTEGKTRTTVGTLDRAFVAIAADEAGHLYGIDWSAGQLWSINPATARTTFIGNTGIVSYYVSSACWDADHGRILWTPTTQAGDAAIYSIDPSTGTSELVLDLPNNEQMLGIFYSPVQAAGTPQAVTDLALSFDGGALQGTLTFTAPLSNADGSTSPSGLTYTLSIDDTVTATGTVAYGQTVAVPVRVAARGQHTFTVTVANEAGASPATRTIQFVGYGTPVVPQNIELTRQDDVNTVSWEAVTGTIDGGYIDPAQVRYTVVRQPGDVTVATDLAETSLTDEVAMASQFGYFYYQVEAINGDANSGFGDSNRLDGGRITPPYLQTFDDAASLDGFTILNENGDNIVWTINSQAAYLKYNYSLASDDWLITPPMVLEAGKLYNVTMDVKGQSSNYEEAFEVMLGTGNTVADMTQTIVPYTAFKNDKYVKYGDYVSVPTTGLYYIGVHGCSGVNKYALYVDNLSISAPTSGLAPAAPAELHTVPSPDGTAQATVYVTAPSLTLLGEALSSAISMTISRNDAIIKSFENVQPGATVSFVDVADEEGEYSYTAVAANEAGAGKPLQVTAYLGVNTPGNVSAITVGESQPGHVTISWLAPQNDADGNPINSDLVFYNIFRPNENGYMVSLQKNVNETSYSYIARPASIEQDFETYGIQAATRRGTSNIMTSKPVPVGTPYALPYKESFYGGAQHHVHAVTFITGGEWRFIDDSTLSGLRSVDGDNGFAAMYSNIATESSMLHTGKIDLTGAQHPTLTFYTYQILARDPDTGEVVGSSDDNTLTVSVNDRTQGFVPVRELTMSQLPLEGWNRVVVDLSEYKNKTIELGFTAFVVNKQYTLIDDVRVFDVLDHNLSVASIDVPKQVHPNADYTVSALIENNGSSPASEYTVSLMHNGVEEAVMEGPELTFGASATVSFPQCLNVAAADTHAYQVVINHAADMNNDDNTSATATATLKHSNVPSPTGLTGTAENGQVYLNWEVPDTNVAVADPITESFEDAEAWSSTVGDWTFVDADNLPIGNMNSIGMPGITNGSLHSWFVNDCAFAGWQNSIQANTGNKLLAQVYCTEGACDDWAISPMLYGGAQTVSFFARSYNSRYLESMEMLYSTTDTNTASFRLVKSIPSVNSAWTLYTFDLPEGARYFAIRCTSDDKAMLFIDDVTFCPYVETALDLNGYNIYRDGERVNATPVVDNYYVDTPRVREMANYTYSVSALYPAAESRPGNAVEVSVETGVAAVATCVNVSMSHGTIIVEGAAGLPVYVADAAGLTIHSSIGTPSMRIVVTPGVYVVNVGGRIFKVMVH